MGVIVRNNYETYESCDVLEVVNIIYSGEVDSSLYRAEMALCDGCLSDLYSIMSKKKGIKMDKNLKYFLENELSGSAYEALNAATQAIYFNDRSDYLNALYDVVRELLNGTAPDDMDSKFIDELVHHLNPDWNE